MWNKKIAKSDCQFNLHSNSLVKLDLWLKHLQEQQKQRLDIQARECTTINVKNMLKAHSEDVFCGS